METAIFKFKNRYFRGPLDDTTQFIHQNVGQVNPKASPFNQYIYMCVCVNWYPDWEIRPNYELVEFQALVRDLYSLRLCRLLLCTSTPPPLQL